MNTPSSKLLLLIVLALTTIQVPGAAWPDEGINTEEALKSADQTARALNEGAHEDGTVGGFELSTTRRGSPVDLIATPVSPDAATSASQPSPLKAKETAEQYCRRMADDPDPQMREPYYLCRVGSAVWYFNHDFLFRDEMASFIEKVWKPLLDKIIPAPWNALTPDWAHLDIRKGITNLLENAFIVPRRVLFLLLQGKFKESAEELERFLANTILGLGGLFDPATNVFKLENHDADCGTTLGMYGVPEGPFIVLPFFEPMVLRSVVCEGALIYSNPLSAAGLLALFPGRLSIDAVQHINDASNLPPEGDADTSYPAIRRLELTAIRDRVAGTHRRSEWPADQIPDLSGDWNIQETDKSYLAALDRDGNGSYGYMDGKFQMTEREGGHLKGVWSQKGNDRDGGFELWLSKDGSNADGIWWYTRVDEHKGIHAGGGSYKWTRTNTPSRKSGSDAAGTSESIQ